MNECSPCSLFLQGRRRMWGPEVYFRVKDFQNHPALSRTHRCDAPSPFINSGTRFHRNMQHPVRESALIFVDFLPSKRSQMLTVGSTTSPAGGYRWGYGPTPLPLWEENQTLRSLSPTQSEHLIILACSWRAVKASVTSEGVEAVVFGCSIWSLSY